MTLKMGIVKNIRFIEYENKTYEDVLRETIWSKLTEYMVAGENLIKETFKWMKTHFIYVKSFPNGKVCVWHINWNVKAGK